MFKKYDVVALLLLFSCFAVGAANAVEIRWTNETGNRRWAVSSNWDSGKEPNASEDPVIVKTGTDGPIFDVVDGNRTCYFVVIGRTGVAGEMWMKGGTLNALWGLSFNKGGYSSTSSTMHMSGGSLHLGSSKGFQIGRWGTATFNMTGGTIECMSFGIPESGQLNSQVGVFNLDGGVVNSDSLLISAGGSSGTGTLNITKGKLILSGDKRVTVNEYVSSGLIAPYPGQTGAGLLMWILTATLPERRR